MTNGKIIVINWQMIL